MGGGGATGAAAVIGTLQSVAKLALPIHVVGLVPATENMPGGRAYKPGDVLTAMNGKTIEIISTDAEGRLILADALAYAARFEPAAIAFERSGRNSAAGTRAAKSRGRLNGKQSILERII